MRNLCLVDSIGVQIPDLANLHHLTQDYDTGDVYAATETGVVHVQSVTLKTIIKSVIDDKDVSSDGSPQIIGIQYLANQMSLCIAVCTGDLLMWNPQADQLECVGTITNGISSMSWSPDQEVVVLTTDAETLLLMTHDFDPITEVPMYSKEFGEADFVTVGWGKKETQFHGQEGKQAAKRVESQVLHVSDSDDRKPRVSWRGDGLYFVVSSINTENGARVLRVWSRECMLHSTSESMAGIEYNTAWKPSGSIIAVTQRSPKYYMVSFMEKNGLFHGRFNLINNDILVKEIMWNNDSSILLVWCLENYQRGISDSCSLQLWTVNNYHWYLKQTLTFSEDNVAAVFWDLELPYRLHIVCSNGKYSQYNWAWKTCGSWGQGEKDLAMVAVIDGEKVLSTPFRTMVVPPPMSAYEVTCQTPVNQVFFGPPSRPNDFAIVTSNENVLFYSLEGKENCHPGSPVCVPQCFKKCKLPSAHTLSLYHITWLKDDLLLGVSSGTTISSYKIISMSIPQDDDSQIAVRDTTATEGAVIGIAVSADTGHVVIQIADGSLLSYTDDPASLIPMTTSSGKEICFPQPCSQMAVCNIDGQEMVLGLTDKYRFYIDGIEIANNCTSFGIHEDYILLTTHSHTCRCISRSISKDVLKGIPDNQAVIINESVRRVERGSRIVSCVYNDTKVVLQMPRGNLETINPRSLVLSAIKKNLNRMEYSIAFNILKKHRLNLNLIHDHNPDDFVSNICTFITQINSVDNLNLFITELCNEDVTCTMYNMSYQERLAPSRDMGKVDKICDVLRIALLSIDSEKYQLPILTTYVKKTKPELDEALRLVAALKGRDKVLAEKTLKYLIFLVDVNELYDVALGTYDFELVIMVAQKSQKDPKEYLPFLNELKKLESFYQEFTIDKYLKRYCKALHHISKCGPEHQNECLEFIKEKKLFIEAQEIFSKDHPLYKDITTAFADYLKEKHIYDEAALMYNKSEKYTPALDCYAKAVNWRQAFIMAGKLEMNAPDIARLATSLSVKLKDVNRYSEAAQVLQDYANDFEEAIVTLIEGHQWGEAMRLMYKHNRTDFIESHLKSEILEVFNQHVEFLSSSREKFDKYSTRLAVVKVENQEKANQDIIGDNLAERGDADLFSDTSSATGETGSVYTTSSFRSKTTGKSSKNRRKGEKKKWSLKEGSKFENLALVEALSDVLKQVDQLQGDISSLLHVMVLFHYMKEALDLQTQFDESLNYMKEKIPEIWSGADDLSFQDKPIYGPNSTANSVTLLLTSGSQDKKSSEPQIPVPPLMKDIKWKLKLFHSEQK